MEDISKLFDKPEEIYAVAGIDLISGGSALLEALRRQHNLELKQVVQLAGKKDVDKDQLTCKLLRAERLLETEKLVDKCKMWCNAQQEEE